jgi:hypothetical protein
MRRTEIRQAPPEDSGTLVTAAYCVNDANVQIEQQMPRSGGRQLSSRSTASFFAA